MTDLLVDFTTLEDSHRAAQTLKSEFDDLPHRVGDGAQWGHHDVHDACGLRVQCGRRRHDEVPQRREHRHRAVALAPTRGTAQPSTWTM